MMTDRDQQKSLLTGAAANPRDEVGNRKARAGTPGTRPPAKGAKHLGKHLRCSDRKARAGTPGTRPPVKGAKHLGKHLRRCTAGMKKSQVAKMSKLCSSAKKLQAQGMLKAFLLGTLIIGSVAMRPDTEAHSSRRRLGMFKTACRAKGCEFGKGSARSNKYGQWCTCTSGRKNLGKQYWVCKPTDNPNCPGKGKCNECRDKEDPKRETEAAAQRKREAKEADEAARKAAEEERLRKEAEEKAARAAAETQVVQTLPNKDALLPRAQEDGNGVLKNVFGHNPVDEGPLVEPLECQGIPGSQKSRACRDRKPILVCTQPEFQTLFTKLTIPNQAMSRFVCRKCLPECSFCGKRTKPRFTHVKIPGRYFCSDCAPSYEFPKKLGFRDKVLDYDIPVDNSETRSKRYSLGNIEIWNTYNEQQELINIEIRHLSVTDTAADIHKGITSKGKGIGSLMLHEFLTVILEKARNKWPTFDKIPKVTLLSLRRPIAFYRRNHFTVREQYRTGTASMERIFTKEELESGNLRMPLKKTGK